MFEFGIGLKVYRRRPKFTAPPRSGEAVHPAVTQEPG